MPWLRQIYKGMTAAQEEKGFDNLFRTIFFTLFVLHLLRRELLCFFFWGGGGGARFKRCWRGERRGSW